MKEKCAFLVVVCLLIGRVSLFADEPLSKDNNTSVAEPIVRSAPLLLDNNLNRIYTRVSINGSDERTFSVDNGWHHTTLDARYMEGLGFRRNGNIIYSAMNKKQLSAEIGSVPHIRVGELEIENPIVRKSDVVVVLSNNLKRRIYGVLGYSTLKLFLTTFDFRKKRIIFSPHSPEAVASIKKHKEVIELPFGRNLLSKFNTHVFSIRISINDRPVEAFIDLGFTGDILTSIDHRSLGLHVNFCGKKTPLKILGFRGFANVTRASEVSIGHYRCGNIKVLYFSNSDAPKITLLGVAFIKRFNVTIDYRNRKVYLQKT